MHSCPIDTANYGALQSIEHLEGERRPIMIYDSIRSLVVRKAELDGRMTTTDCSVFFTPGGDNCRRRLIVRRHKFKLRMYRFQLFHMISKVLLDLAGTPEARPAVVQLHWSGEFMSFNFEVNCGSR